MFSQKPLQLVVILSLSNSDQSPAEKWSDYAVMLQIIIEIEQKRHIFSNISETLLWNILESVIADPTIKLEFEEKRDDRDREEERCLCVGSYRPAVGGRIIVTQRVWQNLAGRFFGAFRLAVGQLGRADGACRLAGPSFAWNIYRTLYLRSPYWECWSRQSRSRPWGWPSPSSHCPPPPAAGLGSLCTSPCRPRLSTHKRHHEW